MVAKIKSLHDERSKLVPLEDYDLVIGQFNKLANAYNQLETESRERIADLEIAVRDTAEQVDEARSHVMYNSKTHDTTMQTSQLSMRDMFPDEVARFENEARAREEHILWHFTMMTFKH